MVWPLGIVMVQVYQGGINGGHVWHGIHIFTVGMVAQCFVMVGVYQGGINGGHVKSLPPDGRLHPEWAEDGRSSSSSSSMPLVIDSGQHHQQQQDLVGLKLI